MKSHSSIFHQRHGTTEGILLQNDYDVTIKAIFHNSTTNE